jgi:hypothetical protein
MNATKPIESPNADTTRASHSLRNLRLRRSNREREAIVEWTLPDAKIGLGRGSNRRILFGMEKRK